MGLKMVKKLVGKVLHYYSRVGVAVIELESNLKSGDPLSFEGPETDLQQRVESVWVDDKPVREAKAGSRATVKTKRKVKEGDHVYLET